MFTEKQFKELSPLISGAKYAAYIGAAILGIIFAERAFPYAMYGIAQSFRFASYLTNLAAAERENQQDEGKLYKIALWFFSKYCGTRETSIPEAINKVGNMFAQIMGNIAQGQGGQPNPDQNPMNQLHGHPFAQQFQFPHQNHQQNFAPNFGFPQQND